MKLPHISKLDIQQGNVMGPLLLVMLVVAGVISITITAPRVALSVFGVIVGIVAFGWFWFVIVPRIWNWFVDHVNRTR